MGEKIIGAAAYVIVMGMAIAVFDRKLNHTYYENKARERIYYRQLEHKEKMKPNFS